MMDEDCNFPKYCENRKIVVFKQTNLTGKWYQHVVRPWKPACTHMVDSECLRHVLLATCYDPSGFNSLLSGYIPCLLANTWDGAATHIINLFLKQKVLMPTSCAREVWWTIVLHAILGLQIDIKSQNHVLRTRLACMIVTRLPLGVDSSLSFRCGSKGGGRRWMALENFWYQS